MTKTPIATLGIDLGKNSCSLAGIDAAGAGAMPVAAGVICDTAMAAVFTSLEVTAEPGSPTEFNSGHDATLHTAAMTVVGSTIGRTIATKDIRHFQFGTHPR